MPVVEYKSKPWRSANPGRIILARPVWAHYGHVDAEKAHKFAIDFGLTETSRSTKPERIYYKGYNDQPVIYISEKTAHPTYFGSAMEAATEQDLERATKVPGAGPIRDSDFPGGGKVVTIIDPDGIPFHVVYGYKKVPVGQPPIAAEAYNNAQLHLDTKARRGKYQRLPKGPSAVFKLGHFGHMSSDVGKISAWYMHHFNIRAMDVQADMKDDTQDFAVFYCLDLGKHYSDHHAFFHFQMFPNMKYPGPHHASFEVHDIDVQNQGHYHLRDQNYEPMWGVGRHLLGSQVFDYWYDTENFIVEHYTDGDVVNEDNPTGRHALTHVDYTIWGTGLPHMKSGYDGDTRAPVEVFTSC